MDQDVTPQSQGARKCVSDGCNKAKTLTVSIPISEKISVKDSLIPHETASLGRELLTSGNGSPDGSDITNCYNQKSAAHSPHTITELPPAGPSLTELLLVADDLDGRKIANGMSMGFRVDVDQAHPNDPDGIFWRRFRAACARAEATLPGANVAYLRARATHADNEAAARERARREAA